MHFPQITKTLKIGDYVIIVLILFFSVVSWVIGVNGKSGSSAIILTDGKEFVAFSLKQNQRINVPGPLGISVVEVKNGHVSMMSSPCPHQLCVRMGSISKKNAMIVCVPNRVLIKIPSYSSNELDAITQ